MVVDCVEGVCVQTETVLRQALGEKISRVLAINKLDRCFLELLMNSEEAYKNFKKIVHSVNIICVTYSQE